MNDEKNTSEQNHDDIIDARENVKRTGPPSEAGTMSSPEKPHFSGVYPPNSVHDTPKYDPRKSYHPHCYRHASKSGSKATLLICVCSFMFLFIIISMVASFNLFRSSTSYSYSRPVEISVRSEPIQPMPDMPETPAPTSITYSIAIPDKEILSIYSGGTTYIIKEPNAYVYNSSAMEILHKVVIPSDEVKTLNIDVVISEVNINYSYDSDVVVTWYTNNKQAHTTSVKQDGTEIILKETNAVSEDNLYSYIEIQLPAGSYDKFDLKTTSGVVNAYIYDTGVTIEELFVNTVNGDIRLNGLFGAKTTSINTVSGYYNLFNIFPDYLISSSVSGEGYFDNIASSNLAITTTSGNINMYSVSSGAIQISSVSGSISYQTGSAPKIFMKTVSADTFLYYVDIREVNMHTTSGNAYITLSEGELSVDFNSITGKFSDFSNRINRSSTPEIKIFFESLSGNLQFD